MIPAKPAATSIRPVWFCGGFKMTDNSLSSLPPRSWVSFLLPSLRLAVTALPKGCSGVMLCQVQVSLYVDWQFLALLESVGETTRSCRGASVVQLSGHPCQGTTHVAEALGPSTLVQRSAEYHPVTQSTLEERRTTQLSSPHVPDTQNYEMGLTGE